MKKKKMILSMGLIVCLMMTLCVPVWAYSKDETVYTKLNPDGSEQTTIVMEHLKNEGEDILEDVTTLSNIINVNGEETFQQNGKKITWESDGKDIYYQGEIEKSLPISTEITYELDGKPYLIDDMLGKSGDVTIRIHYTNHEKHDDLYVPFVVTTGTLLPTDKNSQVTVSHGKVISNGSQYIIIALATPGLQESMGNLSTLDGFDDVVIHYHTEYFELETLLSVATASLLSEENLEVFDRMDEGYSLVDQLASSYRQIEDGGKKLQSGMHTFASRYQQFNQGLQEFKAGFDTAYQGSVDLNQGAQDLYHALEQLDSQSVLLNDGARQTFDALLATASTQLKNAGLQVDDLTIENYETVLKNVLIQISDIATYQVTEAVKVEVTKEVEQQVDLLIRQKVEEQIKETTQQALIQHIVAGHLQAQGIPVMNQNEAEDFIKNQEAGQQLLETQYQNSLVDLKQNGQYEQYVMAAKQDPSYQTMMATYVQQAMNSEDVQNKIKALVAENTSGSDTSAYMRVYQLLIQLETYQQFYDGIQQYTQAVGAIKQGSETLLVGAHQLVNGMDQLKEASSTLLGASGQLNEATSSLSLGSDQLVDGLIQFDEEGIAKIEELINHTLKENVNKVERLTQLAQDYRSFTEVNDDIEAKTKFIMIVNAKKK